MDLSVFMLIILVVGILLIFGLSLLFGDLCGNAVVSETFSPDKKMKVVVFRRDCGATTGYSTNVSIINGWEKLSKDQGGNVYVLDDSIPLNIKWTGNDKVHIKRKVVSRTFTKKSTFLVLPLLQNIEISYENPAAE